MPLFKAMLSLCRPCWIHLLYAQFQTVILIFRVNFHQKITMIDVVLWEISIPQMQLVDQSLKYKA